MVSKPDWSVWFVQIGDLVPLVLTTTLAVAVDLIITAIFGMATWGSGLLAAGAILGLTIGIAHGAVLLRYHPSLRSRPVIFHWLTANAIGGFVALLVSFFLWAALVSSYVILTGRFQSQTIDLMYNVFAILSVASGFGLFGASQWFILRRWYQGLTIWIATNALGGGSAVYLATVLLGSMIAQTTDSDPGVSIGFALLVLGEAILVAMIWAAFSGLGLVLLSSKRDAIRQEAG